MVKKTEVTHYYEGNNSVQLTTAISKQYDSKRNIIQYINRGNIAHFNEYFEADIVYETGKPYNLISLPKEITVKNHSGSVLRKR